MQAIHIVLIVLAVLVSVLAVLTVAAYGVLSYIAGRRQPKIFEKIADKVKAKIDDDEKYTDFTAANELKKRELLENPLKRLEIKNAENMRLIGHLYESGTPSDKYALLCHGHGSSGLNEFAYWAEYFHKRNYNVLMIDHRACGESDGKYMTFGLKESEDTMLWIDELIGLYGGDIKIFVFGISMGAATVLMLSGMKTPDCVKAFAAESSYSSAWDEYVYIMKEDLHMPVFPALHYVNLLSKIIAKFDFKKASPIESVKKTTKPLMIIHGGADDFVPLFMGEQLYEACASENKEFHIVEGSIHARCYQTNSALCEELTDKFTEKYVK